MNKEITLLHENQMYEIVELTKGRRTLEKKWVYKLQFEEGRS